MYNNVINASMKRTERFKLLIPPQIRKCPNYSKGTEETLKSNKQTHTHNT